MGLSLYSISSQVIWCTKNRLIDKNKMDSISAPHFYLSDEGTDGYYVAYKPITLSCILFMFIEMKFIHCHSCVMFAIKSMSMCND